MRGYKFKLISGRGWYLTSTKSTRRWLKKFAKILRLKPSSQCKYLKIIFTSNKSETKNVMDRYPKSVWEQLNIGKEIIYYRQGGRAVIYEIGMSENQMCDTIKMMRVFFVFYRSILKYGGFFMHAGFVGKGGNGYLLAAPGGTGKSTCCRRIPKPWRALCDDMVLVLQNSKGEYFVHPLPTWSVYFSQTGEPTWKAEEYLPLKAIFFLEQSKNDKIVTLKKWEEAILMANSSQQISQSYWKDGEDILKIDLKRTAFENVSRAAKVIPAYRLSVSLHGQFWKEMEKENL